MKILTSIAVSVLISLGSLQAEGDVLAITGGTLIDGNGGEPLRDAVVLLENDRIKAVGRAGAIKVPGSARRIDARGKYVIPGLMDANAHLIYDITVEFMARYEDRLAEIGEEAAQVALKNGITAMFSSWGPLAVAKTVRDRIEQGATPGARVFLAGNIVGYSGPFGPDFLDASAYTSRTLFKRINDAYEQGVGPELTFMTPDRVRERMRAYLAKGVDFVKYGASTHKLPPILFSPRVQKVIVEETHNAGKPVQVHSGSVESLHLAVEMGVDYVQHCDSTGDIPIPDETLKLMVEKKVICGPIAARAIDSGTEVNERNLVKAGVTLAMATDTGVYARESYILDIYYYNTEVLEEPTQLGESHVRWLKVMQDRGLTPMQALQAATRNVALAYHKQNDLGTVDAGKLADLLILSSNPLERADNYADIFKVIKGGREIDRNSLPLRPILTAGPKVERKKVNPRTGK